MSLSRSHAASGYRRIWLLSVPSDVTPGGTWGSTRGQWLLQPSLKRKPHQQCLSGVTCGCSITTVLCIRHPEGCWRVWVLVVPSVLGRWGC